MAPRNMNTAQARVVDPILSTHARGYRNAEFIGHMLFPIVDIPVRGMRVIRFGKESFRKMNTRRAPGAETARVQYGYASGRPDGLALHPCHKNWWRVSQRRQCPAPRQFGRRDRSR